MRVVPAAPGLAPRLRVRLTAAAPVQLEVDTYDGHPRLKATVTAPAPEFAAVLLPLPGSCPEPAGGLGIAVRWPTHTDRITWPADGDRVPAFGGE